MLYLILFTFIIYYLFSIYYLEALKGNNRRNYLLFVTIVVAIVIGIRNPVAWSDSGVYMQDFIDNAKSFGELTPFDRPGAYGEMGFYYLGVIAKSIYNSTTFYFLFVSVLSMLFLYLSLEKYSIFPFIGLYIYLGRFVGRNTIQIRAALAIAIIIWGTVYVTKRQLWKYLIVVFVASRFHTSAYIALPLCLMSYVDIKRWHIYLGLAVAFVIAGLYGGAVNNIVSQSDIANEWARSYVQEDSEKAFSNDLTNPVIWYQSVALILMTLYEDKMKKLTDHYYTFRNGYFYSTIILIVLCQYAVLAARLSTIFATYEIIIIPLFLKLFNKTNRNLLYFAIGILYYLLFFIIVRKYI